MWSGRPFRAAIPDALYWDTGNPYHYVRLQRLRGKKSDFLLIGGEDHKTGQFPEGSCPLYETRILGATEFSDDGRSSLSMVRRGSGAG